MFKILIPFILIMLSGCLSQPSTEPTKKPEKTNKKMFEQEDSLIMFALRAEQIKDYVSAARIFDTLYEKSNRKEYLYKSLQNSLYLKENEVVISKIDSITSDSLDDFILIRLKIVALIQLNRVEEAQTLAINLVEKSKAVNDYILVSDIYTSHKKFDIALKYLESAYLREYSERILDKMSIILYVDLNRKKDAIAQLETHTRVHGCSVLICKRLISIYSNEDNVEGLLSAYLRYYQIDSKPEIAKKIVTFFLEQLEN